MPSCRRLCQAACAVGSMRTSTPTGRTENPHHPVGAAISRPPFAPHPGLPLRGAGMAQSAMTERCYRSALWGSLRESQLPQHLTSKAGWRILRAKALELPAKAGSSRILQSVALRAPPPLKGRLCAAYADGSMGTSTPTICVLLPYHTTNYSHRKKPEKIRKKVLTKGKIAGIICKHSSRGQQSRPGGRKKLRKSS